MNRQIKSSIGNRGGRRITITTTISQDAYDYAKDNHIKWCSALEEGIMGLKGTEALQERFYLLLGRVAELEKLGKEVLKNDHRTGSKN